MNRSISDMSTPSGGGITIGPTEIIAMLTTLPSKNPMMTASMFLRSGGMVRFCFRIALEMTWTRQRTFKFRKVVQVWGREAHVGVNWLSVAIWILLLCSANKLTRNERRGGEPLVDCSGWELARASETKGNRAGTQHVGGRRVLSPWRTAELDVEECCEE